MPFNKKNIDDFLSSFTHLPQKVFASKTKQTTSTSMILGASAVTLFWKAYFQLNLEGILSIE